MERLIHHDAHGYYMACSENCASDAEMCGGCHWLEKAVNRLGAYEDAEAEGLLVVLPCKVGDTVYKIEGEDILPMVAKWIDTFDGEFMVAIQYVPRPPVYHSFDDFGKIVFLTREDAEAALSAKRSNGNGT